MLLAPREEADSKVSMEFSRYGDALAPGRRCYIRATVAHVERSQAFAVGVEGVVVEFNKLLYTKRSDPKGD